AAPAPAGGAEVRPPAVPPPRAGAGASAVTEGELRAWGEALGRATHPPLVIALVGELGAGKTTLVQAICRGYGVTDDVTSPTFALVQQYAAPASPVYHLDLYRLRSPSELAQLGWDELMAERALVIVEWPERAGSLFPADHLLIELRHLPDDPGRRLLLAGGHRGAEAFGGDEA
ncbi:MAG TPA: tRNA (adenosine(37)-N6)-threonylcarbamoyltransferase complex ATPase subunit type 1 TsaE, partial [Gemmatimonadaceae bacterium]